MFYVITANLVVGLHVGYVIFVVLGQVAIVIGAMLRWEWVRNFWFRIAHLLMILIVAAETVIGMTCPLTTWENELRKLGGQDSLEGDFIARVLQGMIFFNPSEEFAWIFPAMYYGFAALVIVTLFVFPPRLKKSPNGGASGLVN